MSHIENGDDALLADDSSILAHDGSGDATNITEDSGVEDPELEAIKARVREMEEEAEKLKEMQTEVDKQMNLSSPTSAATAAPFPTPEEKLEADSKSIYVGNVDYGATAEELEQHFHGCGSVNRVTILCDKFTGHPKGFAYIEFADKDSVITAMALDDSLFRGRQIKVVPKRTNRPGVSTTNRRPRGRGAYGRGGAGRGTAPYYAGFAPRSRRPYGLASDQQVQS
ncbi:unnamed protein product [Candidula unifasciata]|uniref:RRM domain-containing protein n=1 Tax=Candidula unifasciata TaxID=100452 RepID=A0A8S3ZAM5_9EUPU|nr:unnamed protein product [Candidula unifasciata]